LPEPAAPPDASTIASPAAPPLPAALLPPPPEAVVTEVSAPPDPAMPVSPDPSDASYTEQPDANAAPAASHRHRKDETHELLRFPPGSILNYGPKVSRKPSFSRYPTFGVTACDSKP
jgi:hypothetical protein